MTTGRSLGSPIQPRHTEQPITQPTDTPPTEQPYSLAQMMPTAPRRRRTWPWIAAGAVLLVALVAGAFALGRSSGDRGEPAAAPTATKAPLIVRGSLTLSRGDFVWGMNGDTDLRCTGQGGFDDIRGGVPVSVTGPNGTVVAFGELRTGTAVMGDTDPTLGAIAELPV